MLQVHNEGKAAVSTGTEKAELDVAAPCAQALASATEPSWHRASTGGRTARIGCGSRGGAGHPRRARAAACAGREPPLCQLFWPFADDDANTSSRDSSAPRSWTASVLRSRSSSGRPTRVLTEEELRTWLGGLESLGSFWGRNST